MAYGTRRFVQEIDATDARQAIGVTTEKLGMTDERFIQEGTVVILTMKEIPDPGQTDNVKGNTTKAYLLASTSEYGVPSADRLHGTWDMEASGDLAVATDSLRDTPFCVVVDCGIPAWEVTTYKRIPKTKATAKFHLRYVVEANGEDMANFDKVSEAKAFAKNIIVDPSYAHLPAPPESIAIRRKPVSDGGSDLAIGYRRQVRSTKTRPAKVAEGATVKAMHHWIVYGSY